MNMAVRPPKPLSLFEKLAQDPQLAFSLWSGGHVISRAVYVAAKLRVADLLATGPKNARTLAEATGANPDALCRILRALTVLGFFNHDENGRYSLATYGEMLRSDVPGSMHSYALMMGEEQFSAYDDIMHTVETGGTAFKAHYGKEVFDFYRENKGAAEIFHRAMSNYSQSESEAYIRAFDFGRFKHIVDIGAGNGHFLAKIKTKWPKVRATLFDNAAGLQAARTARLLTDAAMVEGDFFKGVPPGGDAYILKHILHDWSDEDCVRILRNVRDAMTSEARVLVCENLLGSHHEVSISVFSDVHMMAVAGGRERTVEEFSKLFTKAGLSFERVVQTGGPAIIEARRV